MLLNCPRRVSPFIPHKKPNSDVGTHIYRSTRPRTSHKHNNNINKTTAFFSPSHHIACARLSFPIRAPQDYGAYLEADAVAAAASCREMEWALQEILCLAAQCADYKANER